MPIKVSKGRKIWVDGFGISCDLSQTDISERQEMLDVTSFCSSGRRRVAGLPDFNVTLTGFYNVSTGTAGWALPTSQQFEPVAFNHLLSKSSAILTIAESSVANSLCYVAKGCGVEANISGQVADLLGLTAVVQGNGALVQGKLLEVGYLSTDAFTANIVDLSACGGAGLLGVSTKCDLHAVVHMMGSTGLPAHAKKITIQGSSGADFVTPHSTLFVWAQGTIDNTTSPGTAKYATTRVSSTKIRYLRITQKSSANSTNAKFKMAIAVGVSRRR